MIEINEIKRNMKFYQFLVIKNKAFLYEFIVDKKQGDVVYYKKKNLLADSNEIAEKQVVDKFRYKVYRDIIGSINGYEKRCKMEMDAKIEDYEYKINLAHQEFCQVRDVAEKIRSKYV